MCFNNINSDKDSITCGVPHGSMLGLIYINGTGVFFVSKAVC